LLRKGCFADVDDDDDGGCSGNDDDDADVRVIKSKRMRYIGCMEEMRSTDKILVRQF
jgi:hypothetical protein